MPRASDARYWREKALRFHTEAANAVDPILVAKLTEFAWGCERTAIGLEQALAAIGVPVRPAAVRPAA
jgi:hypothetical protein